METSEQKLQKKPAKEPRVPSPSALLRKAAQIVLLFVAAGRIDWFRGWFAVAVYAAGTFGIGMVVRRLSASLAKARASVNKGTKPVDRVFVYTMIALDTSQIVVGGLDAGRFHWSSISMTVGYVGAAIFIGASVWVGWTLTVNKFAECTVRIQTDRGHTVVEDGPYRFVRHPMYFGLTLMFLATPLMLGSAWALTVTAALLIFLFGRTAWEDRTLQRELPGYREYATRTRYRLMPGIW